MNKRKEDIVRTLPVQIVMRFFLLAALVLSLQINLGTPVFASKSISLIDASNFTIVEYKDPGVTRIREPSIYYNKDNRGFNLTGQYSWVVTRLNDLCLKYNGEYIKGTFSGWDSVWFDPGIHYFTFTASGSSYTGSKKFMYYILPSLEGVEPTITERKKHNITLSWDMAKGASAYKVSIWERDRLYSGYDEHAAYECETKTALGSSLDLKTDPLHEYIFRVTPELWNVPGINILSGYSSKDLHYYNPKLYASDFWDFQNYTADITEEYYYLKGFGVAQVKAIKEKGKKKEGVCYGMSLAGTSIYLLGGQYAPLLESFDGAKRLSQVKKSTKSTGDYGNGLTAQELIERVHVIQYADGVRGEVFRNANDLNEIKEKVKKNPAVCLRIQNVSATGAFNGAHEIVGLFIEEETETTVKIRVYDPNYPGYDNRYLYLKKNISGSGYSGWEYSTWSGSGKIVNIPSTYQVEKGEHNDLIVPESHAINTLTEPLTVATSMIGTFLSVTPSVEQYASNVINPLYEVVPVEGNSVGNTRFYSNNCGSGSFHLYDLRENTALSIIQPNRSAEMVADVELRYVQFVERSNKEFHLDTWTSKKEGTVKLKIEDYSKGATKPYYTEISFPVKKGIYPNIETKNGDIYFKGLTSINVSNTEGTQSNWKWIQKKTIKNKATGLSDQKEYLVKIKKGSSIKILEKDAKGKYTIDATKKSSSNSEDNKSTNGSTSGTKVKKGTKKNIGLFKYKVTKVTSKGGNVTLIGVTNKKKKSYSVPATVKISGKTYKVTAIGKGAFKNCSKAKKIKLSKNITKIGAQAFKGTYKKLKVIVPKDQYKRFKKLLKKKGLSKSAKIVKK